MSVPPDDTFRMFIDARLGPIPGIRETLAELENDGRERRPAHPRSSQAPPALSAATLRAREVYALRRKRDRVFDDPYLFSDPAWDILLSLFIDEAQGHVVQVLALCAAAHVPTSTAIRWIHKMEDHELLAITDDPLDRRRRFVTLTPKAYELLGKILA